MHFETPYHLLQGGRISNYEKAKVLVFVKHPRIHQPLSVHKNEQTKTFRYSIIELLFRPLVREALTQIM